MPPINNIIFNSPRSDNWSTINIAIPRIALQQIICNINWHTQHPSINLRIISLITIITTNRTAFFPKTRRHFNNASSKSVSTCRGYFINFAFVSRTKNWLCGLIFVPNPNWSYMAGSKPRRRSREFTRIFSILSRKIRITASHFRGAHENFK